MLPQIGKYLLMFGLVSCLVGFLLILADKIPLFGRLPGDIVVRRGNFTLYAPLASSLVISLLITLVINLWRR